MKDEKNRQLLKDVLVYGLQTSITIVDAMIPRIIDVCREIIKNEEDVK